MRLLRRFGRLGIERAAQCVQLLGGKAGQQFVDFILLSGCALLLGGQLLPHFLDVLGQAVYALSNLLNALIRQANAGQQHPFDFIAHLIHHP